MENTINLFDEILNIGFNNTDRILHLGCGDQEINFLDNISKIKKEIYYLGVDADIDKIDEFYEKYSSVPHYNFENSTLQDFLDYTMFHQYGIQTFDKTIITGIFDKPTYKEKQYIFISTVIRRCLSFSKKVIFTMDENNYEDYKYSILYAINDLISSNEKVDIKKKFNKYIFCITN